MSKKNENFNISEGTLVKYLGSDEDVVIPNGVTSISPFAFYGCTTVKSIETPVELLAIGKGAFCGCSQLEQITLPGWLFSSLDINSICDNPEGIYFRFYASPNGDVYFIDSGASQPEHSQEPVEKSKAQIKDAGENENAETVAKSVVVVVPAEEVEEQEEEEELPQVTVEKTDITKLFRPSELEPYSTLSERIEAVTPAETIEDAPIHKHKYIDYEDFLIEGTLLVKYIGTKEDVVIPDTITEIGEHAFSNSNVVNVDIPEGVVKIGIGAFSWCNGIKNIKLPSTLRIIENDAFADCGGLEEIIIPLGVKYIGANAFHACSGAKVLKISPSVTTICRRAFDFCVGLDEVKVPAGTLELAEGIFSHCEGLKRVVLPEGLIKIGGWAFAECGQLKDINYPQSLKSIGDVAFMNCVCLKELNLPENVSSIGRQAYVGCTGLSAVFLPRKLEGQVKPLKVFNGLKKVQVNFVDFI